MNSIDKAITLFEYIAKLSSLKRKKIVSIDEEEAYYEFSQIEQMDPEFVTLISDYTENEEIPYILEIKKPDYNYDGYIELPSNLKSYVVNYSNKDFSKEPSFESYSSYVSQKNISVGDKNYDDFKLSYERLKKQFDEWHSEWSAWAKEQRKKKEIAELFESLYFKKQELENNSESIELVVADGIIQVPGNKSIKYPLLLKKVKIEFDSVENVIRICEGDALSELYTTMLEDLNFINSSIIKSAIEDAKENEYNPLDKSKSTNFFKSFIHSLSPNGEYLETNDINTKDFDITICSKPVFLVRKKTDGLLKTIESIIGDLKEKGIVPKHILDLIGDGEAEVFEDKEYTFEEQLAAISGESIDILLSKQANKEQLEIAENIEKQNAVLVQGPPGTGKTHTIANLLGHFLSQGQNVLVTSQTKKALKVLKDKVPSEVRDLCVTVLDDSNEDMERSIDGISDKCTNSSNFYKKNADRLQKERIDILDNLYETRSKIYNLKLKEVNQIVMDGQSYSPQEIAKYVRENRDKLSYIPGYVKNDTNLPLTYSELCALYKTNEEISEQDESFLVHNLIDPEILMNPNDFSEYIKQLTEINTKLNEQKFLGFSLKERENLFIDKKDQLCNIGKLSLLENEKIDELKNKINGNFSFESWEMQIIADGKDDGNKRKRWELLQDKMNSFIHSYQEIELKLLGKTVHLPEMNIVTLYDDLKKTKDIYSRKGKIGKLDKILNKNVNFILENVFISNAPLQSEEDCELVLKYLDVNKQKEELKNVWNDVFKSYPDMLFEKFEDDIDTKCNRINDEISRCLNWYLEDYSSIIQSVKDCGFDSTNMFDFDDDLESSYEQIHKRIQFIKNVLPSTLEYVSYQLQAKQIEENLDKKKININQDKAPDLLLNIYNAYIYKDSEKYTENYNAYLEFYRKNDVLNSRNAMLKKLEEVAPVWSGKIRNREYLNNEHEVPETIFDAWKWKQFNQIIEDLNNQSLNELNENAYRLSQELHEKTAELTSNLAWYHLVKRTESNINMRQALNNWQLTMRKIGKGTGKRAPLLRKQARIYMAECQKAVPAWIMPMSTALSTLDPRENKFDIVIVDEASQSDISALAILYMAKKVIIVGDDKQVSPSAIGSEVEKILNLQETYIKDIIPGYSSYDANTSLYDIAKTTFKSLMLKEHFRCVPEIIGFSNRLSYDYKIKPLRDDSECEIRPFVIPYRVKNGQRQYKRNYQEALNIVALIQSCIEQKEYEGQTFGVISMLGNDQTKLIQQLLFKHISTLDLEDREILVGDSSGFQGDERDIVFLSLVDSNDNQEGTLRKASNDNETYKQRYNVAASRARNQLWIVHSIDYKNQLKSGDIRRDLLEYAHNPKEFLQSAEEIEKKSESIFEEEVAKSLVARGYRITQQWKVGAYRIDMVAQYKNSKVAVECDGERWHSGEEKIKEDMERQAILERMGWRFIRIRGSQYFSNPDSTIEEVINKLNSFGIYPEQIKIHDTISDINELQQKIYARSNQLLEQWSEDIAYSTN